jgi:hypothetical protein
LLNDFNRNSDETAISAPRRINRLKTQPEDDLEKMSLA